LGLAVLENRVEGDAQKRTQQLAEETEQLSILVEDLLGYLRSEAIPNTPVRERIALCTMLEDITRQEKNTADVRIAQTAECHVLADPVCLRRALGNVIRNAVRYAGTEGPITINLREGSTMLDITVEDCGPGVTVEDLPHITEPFYRGKRARRYPGGSGLGLSIVKHCAEACGGTFTCENILPRGFRVTLRLPIDVKTPAPEISIVKKR
ncbi:MAG: HAMP domain-containing sensor histidine kinase, partial [Ruthenibacterium sp.]